MFRQTINKHGRGLTSHEVCEARKVFGDLIDYRLPRIVRKKFYWFQGRDWIIAPNGHIYWPNAPDDLVLDGGGRWLHTFIHEMAHVYQHQLGMDVIARGLVVQSLRLLTLGKFDPYAVVYEPGKPFLAYNIEQQGELVVMMHRGLIPNLLLEEQAQ